jgi:hypothetical protein
MNIKNCRQVIHNNPGKYIFELIKNDKIPRKFKNLYDISPKYKLDYIAFQRKIRIIDCLLCVTGIIAILLSMIDVNAYNIEQYNDYQL